MDEHRTEEHKHIIRENRFNNLKQWRENNQKKIKQYTIKPCVSNDSES